MSLGGDFDEGQATEVQLIQEKGRLENVVTRLNLEIKDKNGKILDLLETIEDLKIGLYSRDKAIDLFRDAQEKTLNDLRESKKAEIELKAVWIMKNSLEAENSRLQEQLGVKLEKDATANYKVKETQMDQSALTATVNDLQDKLEQNKKLEKQKDS